MLDPVQFVADVLVDPETSRPFTLYDAQRRFLREAFRLARDGRLLYPELVYSAPKKSGKTATAAMAMLYAVCVLGGRFAEGYCCANDLEQSSSRVFQAAARIVGASPILARDAKIGATKIEFTKTGSTIPALANDYRGAAGANPTFTTFDELWGYTSESSHRMWDEMVPPPTRKIAARLTVTYAGFEGESDLLEALYKRGLKGEEIAPGLYAQPGMLMAWHHEPVAPWQTPEWLQQMREQLRPNAYLRMIENRFVSSESTFVDMGWWDACTDSDARPVVADSSLPVFVGVDASTKRDSTAIVATTWDRESRRVRLVWHRIIHPSPDSPINFELDVEETIRDLAQRFDVQEIRFDPYQMAATAQRLTAERLPMIEFPQSVPNVTAASTNLYELVKGRNLIVYEDAEIRQAVNRAVALETSRGWRIAKEKQSHKIDVVVALAMSALGTVQQGTAAREPGDYGLSIV
jgi:phage terminase large subunit-like protein